MNDYTQEILFHNDTQSQLLADSASEGIGNETAIDIICHKLAIELTPDELLPVKFRKIKNKEGVRNKIKKESLKVSDIERNFRETAKAFKDTISVMLEKLDADFAWRCINRTPKILPSEPHPANNQDFIQFIEYFRTRRDIEGCAADETGCLALLTTAFYDAVKTPHTVNAPSKKRPINSQDDGG